MDDKELSELLCVIKDKGNIEDPRFKKVISANSIGDSDVASSIDLAQYERDLEEGNEVINEISIQLEELMHMDNFSGKRGLKLEKDLLNVVQNAFKNLEESKENSKYEEKKWKQEVNMNMQADINDHKLDIKPPVEIPKINHEEIKAQSIKQAKEYELAYLKEHIENIHKDTIHKGITCSECNSDNMKGIRYSCFSCEEYNLCMNCEKVMIHNHPMIKFKSQKHFDQYIKDLLNKFPEILSINEIDPAMPVAKHEEDKKEIDALKLHPKIINNTGIIDFNEIGKYDVYSDEILNKWKVEWIKKTPGSDHTISVISSDIWLTVLLKNTGLISWPKGFKVKSLISTEDAIQASLNEVEVVPSEEILLDIFIRNPKQAGDYYFMFSLVDIHGKRFGDEFEYSFKVKECRGLYDYPQPYPIYPRNYVSTYDY